MVNDSEREQSNNIFVIDMNPTYSRFTSEFRVRPDDIDMNQHVHNSKYLDYVLAARYDQMERCYGMSMDEFIQLGYGWVQTKAYIEYKRELRMGDYFSVTTAIVNFKNNGVVVMFEIKNNKTNKISCIGEMEYTLVSLATGKASTLPQAIIEKYTV